MMDLLDLVVVIFFYIVPLCVSAVVVPRQVEKLSSNNYSLAKIIAIGLLATIIPTFLLYFGNYLFPLFSGFIYIAFLLSPFAVVGGVVLRMFVIRLRLKSEEIIIDLGRIQNKLYALFGFGFVVFYIFIFAFQAFFLTVSDDRFRNIFMALMVLNTIGPSLSQLFILVCHFLKFMLPGMAFHDFGWNR